MWLIDSPYVGGVGQNSVHVLYACEALATLRHTYVDSFLLDPDIVIGRSKYGGDQEHY
jgi:hypothetical protein